jgi:hypothetical protein
MSVYPGRKGVVYMSTTGSGNAINVIKLNAWTLNKTTDKIEVTAFGDLNKTYVQGLPDVQGSFSGFWDDTENKPFTGAGSSDGVKLYLYPSADKAGSYHYGPAWLDASMEVEVSGAVKITANFAANGSWGSVGI